MKFIFACDESGAKGYADQDEQYPGQVGVFAGLLVPESVLAQTETALEAAIAPNRGTDGKLHITGLQAAAQAALRHDLYDAIRRCQLPCFWYAIHVAGFHAHHNWMVGLLDDAAEQARTLGNGVKTGSSREKPDSLHVELFRALYGHMVAFIEERSPGEVEIEARTDRVDTPIAKSFRREADRLLDTAPRKTVASGFDPVANKVIKREIHFDTHWPEELRITTQVKSLDLKIVSDTDPVVVAADVLANSLYHHFRNRGPDELYAELNRPIAVAGHPLAESLDAFCNWGGGDLIGDRMFRHPKAKPIAD
ncbi:hypothetical protein [Sphingomonas sp. PAMC 26617]|uniref:hypothetical protein n=1 Tax=Sphingomonas sp. PAMC 26617 TaxID=1112216 RepID=UPI0002884D62|nr:hypothetical protein [Sphingomonas sp. PAMC 26617]